MLSMTGYARSSAEDAGPGARADGAPARRVTVELRSVNHRFFKLHATMPGWLASWEPRIQQLLRASLARGSLSLAVAVEGFAEAAGFALDLGQLARYHDQALAVARSLAAAQPLRIEHLALLPGVVVPRPPEDVAALGELAWPLVERALAGAAAEMVAMRAREGAALAADLRRNLAEVEARFARIVALAPARQVAQREKLLARVREALAAEHVAVEPEHLVREVAIHAERLDVAEEVARMRSHLAAFTQALEGDGEVGRTLEFLAQEMYREANTIGSKGADGELLEAAIAIKSAIERIKEQLANVE